MRNKKPIYTVIIVLVIFGVIGGLLLAFGRIEPPSKDSSSTSSQSNSQDSRSAEPIYLHNEKIQGGSLGNYYFLTNYIYTKESEFDQIEIDFSGRNSDSEMPYYTIEQSDSLLMLRFSDTSDYDIEKAKSVFVGTKTQTVDGVVARNIALNYPQDDSTIGIDIECNGSEFGYRVVEENLKLIIYIQ